MAGCVRRWKARANCASPRAARSRRRSIWGCGGKAADAETGTGLETGFGVVFADPNLGLMVDAALVLLLAHQVQPLRGVGFHGLVRFDPGLSGRGLSLTLTPSLGAASQGADRLWAMQDMGGLIPYGAMPFDMGGQLAADVGYGIVMRRARPSSRRRWRSTARAANSHPMS